MSTYSLYRNIFAALLSFSLVLGAANTLEAQTPLASVSGVVTDSSGAVIPRVRITAKDTERNQSYHVLTNGSGIYKIPDLLPSNYEITAAKNGFKTYVVQSFPLVTLQKAVINITLSVGSVRQSVNVASQVQMIEPSKATLSGLVNNVKVEDLPLATRNVLTLMATLPGVTPSNPNNYQTTFFTSAARYSINGGMESTSEFELDGVPIVNESNDPGILGVSVMPSLDSIQDVKVQTSDYSAAYGPSGGGITTMTTKSGTNAIHGDVYEFLQNNALDANGFFSNRSGGKVPPIHYDDYGFSLGGPIVKNHTFGFFAFERHLSHEGTFRLFTVPTQAERNGNFSQDFNAAGQLRTIYNPFSTTPNPASPGTYTRTPFPGNVIPSKLLDPVAVKAASYYPAPNLPGQPFTHVDNLGITGVTSSPVQLIDSRVDHNFSGSKRAFVRYDYSHEVYGDANLFGNPADEGYGTMTSTGHNAVLGYTQTFGSSTVLDLRADLNRFVASRPTQGYGFDLTSLGLPSSLVAYEAVGNEPLFPAFSMEGYSRLGNNGGAYYTSANTDYIFSGHLSHVVGKQIITGGADSIFFLLNFFQVNPFVANFSNDMTQGPNPLTVSSRSGDGFASFLLGTGDSGNIGNSPQPANASHYFAQYIEDDIKWTPKFTINLGFRLEEQTTTTERFNRLTAINPLALNPVSKDVGFNVYGGFVFAGNGPDSLGRRNIAPMQINPNPRIGIAYMLNNKTVIRAGYGIFYGIPDDGATNAFTGSSIFGTSSAFSTSTPWLATLDGIHPNNLLSDPFPQGYVYPQGSAPGLLSGVGTSLASGWPQTLKTMYNQQWNFTVQRSFGNNMLLQLAYVGNKATHLGMKEPIPMNQLPPSDMSQGNALLNLVPNPFYGYVQPGTLDQPTVQQGQLERPFPEWESVQPVWDALGNSEYDALQVLFQKRFTHGNSFSASYVWSKTMADVFSGYWNGIGPIRSWYCLSCEHSVANFDVPQRFVLSWVAALPFGSGQRFGSNWHGIEDVALGGWQANGILTLASGMPLVFSTAQNTTHSFGGGQHPNLTTASPFPAKQSINEWFNPAAFAQPANFTFGNLGMTFTPIRQDWTRDLDFSLFKNFSVTERFKLQLRGEAFNITNTPIFGAPDTAVGSSGFGVIGSQANSARVVQLGLKLLF